MICHIDAKSLEWVGIVWFSQDKVGIQELLKNFDQHTDNQNRFKLPSRLIAKTFVFRLIYGGSAWAYVKDPDFATVGFSAKKWQEVIDKFYDKYPDIGKQHETWVQTVTRTGKLIMPTGREYHYKRYEKRGEMVWPRTTILNYPVQGLGHDLMAIVRVLVFKYLLEANLEAKLISTVHDSIDIDCPKHEVKQVIEIYNRAFVNTPKVFHSTFGHEFNVPFRGEISIGLNLKELEEVNEKVLTKYGI